MDKKLGSVFFLKELSKLGTDGMFKEQTNLHSFCLTRSGLGADLIAIVLLLIVAGAIVTTSAISAQAQGEAWLKDQDGIVTKLGNAQVVIAAVNDGAFRLSVSSSGDTKALPSIFINAAAHSQVVWQPVQAGDFVGVKTKSGELLINTVSGIWTLKDAHGKIVIPVGKIKVIVGESESGRSHISIDVAWENHQPLAVYGSGNGVPSLMQFKGDTHLDNGVAVIPYYWCPSGYSALAVTGDDNRPATWRPLPSEKGLTWEFPGPRADLYLMPAANLRDAAKAYGQLSGYPPVPPRWTFGYLQSRWGWKNRAYIEDTLRQFITRKLPVDGFIYDFEWYAKQPDYSLKPEGLANFDDFGWNSTLFPKPSAQIAAYKAQGIHFVGIRKPRLGNSELLQMMHQKGWGLPGWEQLRGSDRRMIDFQNPKLRSWYADQTGPLLKCGVDGWWNDEGEASFTTYYYWNLAEEQAQSEFKPGTRLWTLNRAFEPGLQRLGAAAWTGDIKTSWQSLKRTPTDLLNWSLAGMPYTACDIGGFHGDPTPTMFVRWMQVGVFLPIMRAHSTMDVPPHFPWLYGPQAEEAIRKALDLRYRLIPYYYSLAHNAHQTGIPLMRPLVMEFPKDPKVANLSDQWLMGSGLMAAPILSKDEQRSVYLPKGKWFVFDTNQCMKGGQSIRAKANLDQVPVYVRSGTILPLAPVLQHTDQLPGGPLELQIYPGKDATFTMVEDDGHTTNYLNGEVRRTVFSWDDKLQRLTWSVEGSYDGSDVFRMMNIEVFYPSNIKHAKALLDQGGTIQL